MNIKELKAYALRAEELEAKGKLTERERAELYHIGVLML